MIPELSTGWLKWILKGVNVISGVFQILGYEKIPDAKNVRYRFILSDSETWSYAVLGKQLNHMVANKELEKFCIVQVDKCIYKEVEADKKEIILSNLTVLVPGNKMNGKLGNPVNTSADDETTKIICNIPVASDVTETSLSNYNAMMMFPQLTAGAISQILNEEEVANPVVQIIGLKKSDETPDFYRLVIFDGWPFVMLGTHLNHMVANKELEKSAVVRVEEYEYKQVTSGPKMLILLKITVLNSGNDGNRKFGDSFSSSYSVGATANVPAANDVTKTSCAKQRTSPAHYASMKNGSVPPVQFTQFLYTMFPEVASGAINRILNGEEVANAVIQILGCQRIPGSGNDRYHLLISDGVTGFPFAMLGTQLNHMVANKELEKFTVVRVEKYTRLRIQADKEVIILLNLSVLVPGNEVNKVLGNPVSSSSCSAATTKTPTVNDATETDYSNETSVAANDLTKINDSELTVPFTQLHISSPQLTHGSINQILNGENVANPVVQILGCKRVPGAGVDRYRLLISDGITGCSFVMLGTQLNHMVANKELEKFTIVQVDRYVCNQVQVDRKVIILLNLTVIAPGNAVNEKLGNPINSSN
ncbi:unnamed protein product [Larinioides sclopetarius]|uniref:Replication factor-A protein 1 N-terminal domain-containing protein n=1 Tax=Larinioides sclopetarius TaxID=280406 RepID=A0AAV2AZ83_9ARAC